MLYILPLNFDMKRKLPKLIILPYHLFFKGAIFMFAYAACLSILRQI